MKIFLILIVTLFFQEPASALTCRSILNQSNFTTKAFSGDTLKVIEVLSSSLLSLKISEGEYSYILGEDSSLSNLQIDEGLLALLAVSRSERLTSEQIDQIVTDLKNALLNASKPENVSAFRRAVTQQERASSARFSWLRIIERSLQENSEELERFLRANIKAIVVNALHTPNRRFAQRVINSRVFNSVISALPGLGVAIVGAFTNSDAYVGVGIGWLTYWYISLMWSSRRSVRVGYRYNYELGAEVRALFQSNEI